MAYEQEVKEAAYKIDPECWESYSGKDWLHHRAADARRLSSLQKAQKAWNAANPKPEEPRSNIRLDTLQQCLEIVVQNRYSDNSIAAIIDIEDLIEAEEAAQ